jgi:hypothetical protein
MRKNKASPGHRKRMALEVVEAGLCSGRAACRWLRLSRSTFWYRSRPATPRERQMLERMRELSGRHPRYGYQRIAALLRQEGWSVGKRHIQRLQRQEEVSAKGSSWSEGSSEEACDPIERRQQMAGR